LSINNIYQDFTNGIEIICMCD